MAPHIYLKILMTPKKAALDNRVFMIETPRKVKPLFAAKWCFLAENNTNLLYFSHKAAESDESASDEVSEIVPEVFETK